MNFIEEYFQSIKSELARGNTTEHSFRPALKSLLENLNEKITATNEPKQRMRLAPDFVIMDSDNIPRGYIEAKDIVPNILDKKENQGQIHKYFRGELGYNFIHTDNLEFRFYRNDELMETAIIGKIENGKLVESRENFVKLENLLKNFLSFHGQTLKSSKKLSTMMAGKARLIQSAVLEAVQNPEENDPFVAQLEAFRKILMHGLTEEEFADIYAQTLVYGLFAARLHDPTLPTFSRYEAAELLPTSNPFLKRVFKDYIVDLDARLAWIVDDLIGLFKACDVKKLLDSYGKNTQRNDPVIHFYEDFLGEYNPKLRKSRGVYYTPEPVVDFIVSSVDEILIEKFGIKKGLASNETISRKVRAGKRNERFKDGEEMAMKTFPKVQILDPATGTGTFLAQVIKQIFKSCQSNPSLFAGEIPRILPRLHGFEIMMASYAMAHLKLELLLDELSDGQFSAKNKERLGIYLTNSLEEGERSEDNLFGILNWLSDESKHATEIKKDKPVMVVLGNPPYAVSSNNKSDFIMNLIADYKKDLNERKINLDDDYIKFIRLAENYIEKNGEGVLAYISNNSFIDGITHRQMRKHLMETFDEIYILDLHGNAKKRETCPDGSVDKNVFDIMQGVSINIFVKKGEKSAKKLAELYHADLQGKRDFKYETLFTKSWKTMKWKKLKPVEPYYFFAPKDFSAKKKYDEGFSIKEMFIEYNSGIQTKRDALTIQKTKKEIEEVEKDLKELSVSEIRIKYNLKKDGRDWSVLGAKNDIIENDYIFSDILYKPFDVRKTLFTGNSKGFHGYPRSKTMKHFVNKENLGLCLMRTIVNTRDLKSVFISNTLMDLNFYGFQTYLFPLYLYEDDNVAGNQESIF